MLYSFLLLLLTPLHPNTPPAQVLMYTELAGPRVVSGRCRFLSSLQELPPFVVHTTTSHTKSHLILPTQPFANRKEEVLRRRRWRALELCESRGGRPLSSVGSPWAQSDTKLEKEKKKKKKTQDRPPNRRITFAYEPIKQVPFCGVSESLSPLLFFRSSLACHRGHDQPVAPGLQTGAWIGLK